MIRHFRFSLLGRVAMALVLVGLLPVAVLAWRLVGLNRDAMESQVELAHTRAAATIATRIGEKVVTLRSFATSIAASRALADPESAPAQDLLRTNLGALSQLGVLAIAVVDPDGNEVLTARLPEEGARERVRAALAIASNDRVVAVPRPAPVEAEEGGESGEPLIDLRVAAELDGGRGFVWLVADGSEIRAAVLEPEQIGREARVTLAHRDGFAILGSLDPYPDEVLTPALNPNVEGFRPRFDTGEGEVIGGFSAVPHTSWSVLSHQSLEVAHAVANEMERESWLAVSLVTLSIAVLSGFAWVTVVRPIRQLAAAQRRLAGAGAEDRGNEIEQLQNAFDLLEQRLKDRSGLDEVFLGRYQVRDVIGSGAMGTVFLGYDPRLERQLALKTMRLDRELGAGKRRELLDRLLQEAVTTAKFNHPNIVAVFDVEESGSAAYMAMEYVDGTSLETLVWRRERLTPDETVVIGAAIAGALAVAHSHGFVHRDVKPANILLGKDGSIKVTDFGIAELLSSMRQEEDVVFGTPGYLPPETLQGKGYDASGDLFSLGAVLYYCLTGQRPFEGKSVKEVIRRTLFGSIEPLAKAAPGAGRDLEALVMGLMERDREQRPKSARQVADRLEDMARMRGARWQPDSESFSGEEAASPATQYVPTAKLAAG